MPIAHQPNIDLADLMKEVLAARRNIWTYQEFSVWMTNTMRDAGNPAQHGKFRQTIARARLDNFVSLADGRSSAQRIPARNDITLVAI
ncbi:hypothetical protein [Tunturiibacter gelidiferens]|uniref:hypothetical protein n=1 Tax=Tunturiibacter gelidiferens TaxID=3069689 RepID=UPI003D9B8B91